MKWKPENAVRLFLFLMATLLLWSVWSAMAQTGATENVSTSVTNVTGATNEGAGSLGDKRSGVVTRMATPAWIERLAERFPLLKKTWWGNEVWKYLLSLVYVFLAFYVSKFLDYLTRVWLKKLAAKTKTQLDDLLLELLNGPVKVVAFVIFLHIGLEVFDWPEVAQAVLAKSFKIIVAVSITYMLVKVIDLLMGYWRQRAEAEGDATFNKQLYPIIRKSLKAFVVMVAVLVTLSNIGIDVTAAIASLSIGGLALGLAAQDTLSNMFGAIAIFLDKPFKLGDRVQLDQVDGVVESIGLRSTRVRNLDGHLITVPNKTMGNATITNVTLRPNIRTLMNLSVTYNTPATKVSRAVEILNEIYKAHEMTQDVWISFNKFADASLNIFIIHWWKSTVYKDYLAGMQKLNLTIKERFDAEKIEFAFPTQTLYVKQDSEWRFALPPNPSAGQVAPPSVGS